MLIQITRLNKQTIGLILQAIILAEVDTVSLPPNGKIY